MPRKSQAKNSADGVFPIKQDTEVNRMRFLARMGYISLAHYLLYRGLVPLTEFKRRRIEGVLFYCFNHEKRWGQKLSAMMKGMKEAIDKKYAESAFIMINENPEKIDSATEVFTVRFAYDKDMVFSITNDKGDSIVSMQYIGEEAFRDQVKYLIKKINTVTKALEPLKPKAVPYLKLTYHPGTPDEYEPANFSPCKESYTFGTAQPISYDYGDITTDNTAITIHLKSVYIKKKDIARLEDALADEVGIENEQYLEENNEDALDNSRFEDDDPHRVPLSPEHATPQLQVISAGEEEEMDMEVEVQRQNSNEHSNEENPLDNNDSTENKIQPDETIDKETPQSDETIDKETPQSDSSIEKQQQMITPKYRRPKRMLTPRLRYNPLHKRKLSISDSEVMKSPQDLEDYNE